MPEAISFELRGDVRLVHHGVISQLSFGRRDVADGLQQPAIVEPINPFQRCELDGVERPPRPAPMDDLGFVETVDGLGQSIVVAVADAADRRFDAGFGQALGVFDRDVLAASVALLFVKWRCGPGLSPCGGA